MIDKGKAFDYVVNRGYLSPRQVMEANEYAETPADLGQARTLVRAAAAQADRAGNKERHHALMLAMAAIDDAREA